MTITTPDNEQILGLIIDINEEEDTEHRDLAVDITQKAGAGFTNPIANADFASILKDVVGVPTGASAAGSAKKPAKWR